MWIDNFRARVASHPDRTALLVQGRATSYQALWERSAAAGLAACHATPGPRHLIALGDTQACLEAIIGAWIHGKVPVTVAPDMPPEALERMRRLIANPPPPMDDPQEREGLIMATSGSTGLPKLAVLPHRSLNVGMPAIAAWFDQPDDSQAMVPGPTYLSRVLVNGALVGLWSGWTLHLFPGGVPGSALQAHIRTHGITVLSASASFYRLFFQYGSASTFPSLRHVSAGGEFVPKAVVEQMRRAFPEARTYVTFGSTESGTRIANFSTEDPRAGTGAVGIPLPYLEPRIDPLPEVPAPAGELLLRGTTVFLGYLQLDGSYTGVDADGFYRTGDLVRPDPDGCLHHLGRIGGLVKVGGLMVNPSEVEQILLTLPGVADAMCWAEPHGLLGNAIAAQVVPLPGVELDPQALRRACRDRMERHKVPRTLTVVQELPVTPAGKRSLKPPRPA